ncbi:MAG: protein translocase subunit SecDF [Paludibacter sp.]|nr:protein translocase subunit SecDF [Paludibacter sp.]MDD4198019.1 protein translocase subunit SecDF [Paludibacter sp.]MDD4428589.1 protein translocase subunit SecDF [Paludibacter sp.]
MQNKGIVRVLAILLALVSLFYLSFSVVTGTYNRKAKEYAAGDKMKEYQYLDSLSGEKVYFGYTLKECREKEINLGLDLKGGMNVTLEVSVADILRALSGYNNSPEFLQALQTASERQKTNSQIDYLDLFVKTFEEINPQGQLASVFSTMELKDKISLRSTNNEVVSVLRSEIDGAISNSFNVLRSRIDRFGVVQPNIQRDNNNVGRILIELPGVKEPERVRKLLQGSANLEFWETFELSEIVNNLMEADRVLAAQQASVDSIKKAPAVEKKDDVVKETPVNEQDSLVAALKQKEVSVDSLKVQEQFKKEHPLLSVLQIPGIENGQFSRGPVVGYAHYKDTARVNSYFAQRAVKELLPANLGLRWTVKAVNDRGDIYQLIAIKTNRDNRAPLGGDAVTDARADFSQTSAYANVSMSMNSEGAKIWARMTKENIGKSIAIALDGYIYSFPTVNTEITGGQSQITGNFTVEEAKDLANTLKSGKMPAPARIVQEDIVGPSLGQDAINSGLVSFVIAFLLVLLYMIFYYGLIPGLIADLALFANVFFLFGILASFSAVLTLPGIAGIVLTLGMAVDANVLIYERIREELRAGKSMKRAIDDGFKGAISAIIDANVTTLITGIVLSVFGTGPIKGFANTLIIGIITSFISAVFLTRLMLDTYANSKRAKELPFTTKTTQGWFQNAKLNFLGGRKIAYIISSVLILISVVSFATRGFSLGIDFSGGRNYVVRFEESVKTQDVRDMLSDAFDGTTVQVITIGSDNQVRISTKFKIDDNSDTIDDEIELRLYNGLKPVLKDASMEEFKDQHIQSSQKVGPTIADDIKRAAVWAVLIAIIAIGLYILVRFRNVSYSLGAIIGLVHDTIVTLGAFSLLYSIMPFSMEIDQAFIAAILTVVGYSVNDTVIIFDRIREFISLYPKRDRKSVINDAINAMLSRTFSTSMSTILVLLIIFMFGGETIRGFIFAMLFGIVIGTYSSIFIAAPVSYEFFKRKEKKEAAKIR